MQRIHYPKEQMHRIRYTKLTPHQIGAKLVAAAAGPKCASPLSDRLAGKSLKIVTDDGPTLHYTFHDRGRLTLAESGGASVDAGYGALELKHVVLLSHMVPGTQRGYEVVIDRANDLATVFEIWFSGYAPDNREVQRQIYYGYVEVPGRQAPKARHATTNRIEGKGFHWKQDTGIETLELYPSVLYSAFVELTRLGGELAFCAPSDFIKLDDSLFVYSRVECNFSGTLTLYVLDLYTRRQVGMRLGLDANDALEYYMYTGDGQIVGQLAHFERFSDHGQKIELGSFQPASNKKGTRPVYRPLLTTPPMTEAEVHEAVTRHSHIFEGESPMAGNRLPLSDALVGKTLTLRYDGGPAWNYRFDSAQRLRWRRDGEQAWHEEVYRAFEPAEDLYMFSHVHSGTRPNESVAIVVDLQNALTTCVHAKLGTKYMANEVSHGVLFGIVEMDGLIAPQYRRHHLTDELVGRSLTWNYTENLTSQHVYATPHSLSWIIFLDSDAGGLEWSGPCFYVKLRDDTYLFSWVEEACNGSQGTLLWNTRSMHDCGFSYGVSKDGLRLSTIGAYARDAGRFDIRKFYGAKQV